MEHIFKPVHRITQLVKSQIKAVKTKIGQFPKAVIVAGGFGKNPFLQIAINEMVKDNFDDSVSVIQYTDNIGWLSVADGALRHAIKTGRKVQEPAMVARRMSRHRYGFRQANQGVKWFLEKEASISTEEANAFQVEPKDFQVLLSMGRKYLALEVYSQSGKTSLVQRACVVKWLQEQEPRSHDSFHLGLVHDGMSVTFTLYVDGQLQGPGQVNFEYGY